MLIEAFDRNLHVPFKNLFGKKFYTLKINICAQIEALIKEFQKKKI
jgi:hypothetical protein